MLVVDQVHLLDLLFHKLVEVVASDSLDGCIELQVLEYCKVLIDTIELWTVPKDTPCLVKAIRRQDIVASHVQFA